MNRPTDILTAEHRALERALRVMTRAARRLDTAEAAGRRELAAVLDFLSAFADGCHHAKEEAHLFPALEGVGVSRRGGPIGVMLAEHREAKERVAGMRSELNRGGTDAGTRRRLRHAAEAYAALLRRHIEKEETVLFPLADRLLSAARQEAVVAGFDRVERRRFDPERHESCDRLLADLVAV